MPLSSIAVEHGAFPRDWRKLSYQEMTFSDKHIFPETNENCYKIEEETINQNNNIPWHKHRKYRITSSEAHEVCTRKKNFETLVTMITLS